MSHYSCGSVSFNAGCVCPCHLSVWMGIYPPKCTCFCSKWNVGPPITIPFNIPDPIITLDKDAVIKSQGKLISALSDEVKELKDKINKLKEVLK